jgi:hypothetical protein
LLEHIEAYCAAFDVANLPASNGLPGGSFLHVIWYLAMPLLIQVHVIIMTGPANVSAPCSNYGRTNMSSSLWHTSTAAGLSPNLHTGHSSTSATGAAPQRPPGHSAAGPQPLPGKTCTQGMCKQGDQSKGVGYTLLRHSHQTVSGTCPPLGHYCHADQVSGGVVGHDQYRYMICICCQYSSWWHDADWSLGYPWHVLLLNV